MNFNSFKKTLENGKKVAKVAVIGAVGLGALNSCDGNKTNDNKFNNYNDKTKNVDVKSDTQAPNSISFNEAKNDLDFEEREKAEIPLYKELSTNWEFNIEGISKVSFQLKVEENDLIQGEIISGSEIVKIIGKMVIETEKPLVVRFSLYQMNKEGVVGNDTQYEVLFSKIEGRWVGKGIKRSPKAIEEGMFYNLGDKK